jgi:hypothetical protein
VQTWAAGEVFDERQDQPMNRLWRRLDVTVTLIAQGSGRLHAHGVNANRYGRNHESRFLFDSVRLNA